MPFKAPHVSFVSFALEVHASGTSQVMIVETDLHLNTQHSAYDAQGVNRLLSAAQDYASANMQGLSCIRLVSNRSGEV
jgi:hypothetical protein